MGETSTGPALEPPRDVFGLLRYAAAAVAANTAATEATLEAARRVEAVVRQALDRPAAPALAAELQAAITAQILCTDRLADQGLSIRALPAAMRDMALVEASATAPLTLAGAVPEARSRRARHRAGRERGMWPRAVPGSHRRVRPVKACAAASSQSRLDCPPGSSGGGGDGHSCYRAGCVGDPLAVARTRHARRHRRTLPRRSSPRSRSASPPPRARRPR